MIEKEAKEKEIITLADKHYFYIKLSEIRAIDKHKEVEIVTRREADKTDAIIKKAKELLK